MNPLRGLVAATVLLTTLLAARHANAQMSLDAPQDGASLAQPFSLGGWAIDTRAASGPGVLLIHVWAFPNPGSGAEPQFWGEASYGGARPDIASIFGSEFTHSGYGLTVWGRAPGVYQIVAYAYSTVTGAWDQSRTATVTLIANPQMSLDIPADGATLPQPFSIGGWALDSTSASGTGIDAVHVWAYPNPGSGAPAQFWGVAEYGTARPDLGAIYGGQFTNCGYTLSIAGRAPGVYQVVVYAHNAVINQWDARAVTVTITANPQMNHDVPSHGAAVYQPFTLGGWAIDLAAASGSGVDTVHVWAYPNPGSGAPGQFWGAAGYGAARPDVGAMFGSQFTNAGYSLSVTGRPEGVYQVVVFAHSVVTGSFSQARSFNITLEAPPRGIAVETPSSDSFRLQPITVSGWAIDGSAPVGAGVDLVHVYALPVAPSGPAVFVGAATYGLARQDIGSAYGGRFTNSGYSLNVSGMAAGTYRLTAYARSTASGSFDQSASVTVHADLTVAPPFVSPGPGTYTGPLSITAVSATTGAVVRYTLDGSEPTGSSFIASSPISALGSLTLKTKAFATGMHPSPTVTGTYLVQVPAPALSPPGGTYDTGQPVTITVNYPATIRYSTDGSDPTATHPVYTSPLSLAQNTTIKARAFMAGALPSAIAAASYSVRVARPVMTPTGGEFGTAPVVEIVTPTPGATIRYTLDRSEPTASSPVYAGGIPTNGDTTIKAIAFKSGLTPSVVITDTYMTTAVVNAPETSAGSISIPNVTATAMNAAGASVTFNISGASLSSNPADTLLYRNGVRLPAGTYSITPSGVTLPNVLQDGANRLELEAIDSTGLLLNSTISAWAGSRALVASVRSIQGAPISGATLTLTLVDDGQVEFSGTTNGSGQASFFNLPSTYAIRITASAAGYRPWTLDLNPSWTSVDIWLEQANNDFSENLTGWTVSTTRAILVPHSELSQPLITCPDCIGRSVAALAEATPSNTTADMDLAIDTKNLFGPQTVTRRFTVAPGTTSVSVRYRFQTDEIFTAYPANGTFRNDSYAVTLRSVTTGQQVQDTQTVGSLFGTYDVNGAAPWQTRTLPITAPNEVVELTLSVANATDNAHMSLLYADVLQEVTYQITSVHLRDLISTVQGSGTDDPHAASRPAKALEYLSASPHAAYDGYVRVHGSIAVRGPSDGSLQAVWVEVLENGVVKATGDLARSSVSTVRSSLLNRPFGSAGSLSVLPGTGGLTPVLFEIPSSQLASLSQTTNDRTLHLRIRARRENGMELPAFSVPMALTKLVRYTAANRFGTGRDLADCTGLSPNATAPHNRPPFPCGDDSWSEPDVAQWATGVSNVTWNDFSNMNGGFFPPHSGHRDGRTIDGRFPGYASRDAAAANSLLTLLNQHGSKVVRVLVSYFVTANCGSVNAGTPPSSDPFWGVILNAPQLPDGRWPRGVVLNAAGHCDHFDVRLR